jgi:hypothetical protein
MYLPQGKRRRTNRNETLSFNRSWFRAGCPARVVEFVAVANRNNDLAAELVRLGGELERLNDFIAWSQEHGDADAFSYLEAVDKRDKAQIRVADLTAMLAYGDSAEQAVAVRWITGGATVAEAAQQAGITEALVYTAIKRRGGIKKLRQPLPTSQLSPPVQKALDMIGAGCKVAEAAEFTGANEANVRQAIARRGGIEAVRNG